jgi:hypothetical protein
MDPTIHLIIITHESDFFILYDELLNDHSGFIYNRSSILNAYKNGLLYGLKQSTNLLPCLCILRNSCNPIIREAEILWVHTRMRQNHLGQTLIHLLNINYARILSESIVFWQKCGFQIEKNHFGGLDIATNYSFNKQTRSGLVYNKNNENKIF